MVDINCYWSNPR